MAYLARFLLLRLFIKILRRKWRRWISPQWLKFNHACYSKRPLQIHPQSYKSWCIGVCILLPFYPYATMEEL